MKPATASHTNNPYQLITPAMAAKPRSLLLLLLAVVLGFLSSPSAADNVLYPGASLLWGQSLVQGNHSLVMQRDCNLVLYHGHRPVWASQTFGWGSHCRADMQRDGNLVVYTGGGKPVWASGTQRNIGNYVLVLQPNGDVVVYGGSLWATGTSTQWTDGTVEDALVGDAVSAPVTVAKPAKVKEGRGFGLGWMRGIMGDNRP